MRPWLKRIDLLTGAASAVALRDGELRLERGGPPLETSRERPTEEQVTLLPRGDAWHARGASGETWLLHGSTVDLGDALYVFMEHPEARNATLEAALAGADEAALVYADWLEEQGDPFAAAVKPELAKAAGPAGLWWLEGLERGAAPVEWEARHGFLRRVRLSSAAWQLPWELLVYRVLHLRAAIAIEHLELTAGLFSFGDGWDDGTGALARLAAESPVWRTFPFPPSLQTLVVEADQTSDEVAQLRRTLEERGISLVVKRPLPGGRRPSHKASPPSRE